MINEESTGEMDLQHDTLETSFSWGQGTYIRSPRRKVGPTRDTRRTFTPDVFRFSTAVTKLAQVELYLYFQSNYY